jgi:hypothetical protein
VTSNAGEPLLVPPEIPAPADEAGLVRVFVTTGVRTSAGAGPGVRRVPPEEAGRLVTARVAVHGDKPPRGWTLPAEQEA